MSERVGVDQTPGDTRDWFRLGMVSATVVTPLITRWRALRAAERARALWQARQASVHWPWPRPADGDSTASLPPLARREVRTELWLAGVAVGLAVAGTAAFIVARRRWHADEPPLDLPLITHAAASSTADARGAPPPSIAAHPPTAGAAPGSGAAEASGPASAHSPASAASNGVPHRPPPPVPRFVGNTQTLLYVSGADAGLPPEELRVYFASEHEATQAGYRLAPGPASAPDPRYP